MKFQGKKQMNLPKSPTVKLMKLRLKPTKQAKYESCPEVDALSLYCLYSLIMAAAFATNVAMRTMIKYISSAQYLTTQEKPHSNSSSVWFVAFDGFEISWSIADNCGATVDWGCESIGKSGIFIT